MLFTIITVCRNAARTIARTIRSVNAQDHPDVEHLIIDGLSSDGTVEIATGLAGDRTRIVSEKDAGLYDAMNKGVALSSGAFIAFLNADDFYPRPTILSEVAAALGGTEADALFGDVAFFRPDQPDHIVRTYRSRFFRPSRLRWGLMPAHPATFASKRLFEKVGGFTNRYSIAADFDMAVRMFGIARASYIHYPHTLVHMEIGGISTQGFGAMMTINREAADACRRNGIYSNPLMIAAKYPLKAAELLL